MLALIAAAFIVLKLRGQSEIILPRMELAALPPDLAGWKGTDLPIRDEVREILGAGDFLQRIYQPVSGGIPIDLFIAYFPSQRTGATLHSPKNCLPGSGWTPLEASYTELALPNGRRYPVNRYLVGKGEEKQLVLYWYQAHDRMVASEYAAKFYLIADAIRMNRSDGAMIRVVTPMAPNESATDAEAREKMFLQKLLPQLQPYLPS